MLFLSQERLYSGLYIKLQIRGEAKQSILFTNQKTQWHRKKIERGGARLILRNLAFTGMCILVKNRQKHKYFRTDYR